MKEVPFVVERRKWCVHRDWRRVGTTIVLRAGRRSTVRSTKVGVVKPQNKTNHVIVMAHGDNVGEVPPRVQSKSQRNSPWQSARACIESCMQLRKHRSTLTLSTRNPIRRSLVLSSGGFCLVFRCWFSFLFRCMYRVSCHSHVWLTAA